MGRFNRGFHGDPKLAKQTRAFKAARLIVRNLSFASTEENVKEHFSQYGEVVEVTLLRKNNRFVGCGFVQFKSKAYAAAAIHKTSGKPFLGRIIVVDWALGKDQYQKSQRQGNQAKINEEPVDPIDIVKEEVLSESDSEENINFKKDLKSVTKSKNDDKSDSENSTSDDEADETEDDENEPEDDESNESDEENEPDDSTSEGESDEDNDSDEDVKPDVKKIKKRKIEDVLEERTVFIKNVPFMATEDDLEKAVKHFGPILYAKICIDPLTEHSKGTAFVKFETKESADACLAAGTEFTLNGTILDPHPALPRKEVRKKLDEPKKPSDSRNLYLLKEGVITAGSKAAEGVSTADMAKRLQIERWKREIIKDLGKFVSRYRLVIHNMPFYYDDKRTAALVKKYCPKNARFKQIRVMRDLKDVDKSGVGKSKGFAFVSFDKHEDALATLRALNNNPTVFKPQKRPIVSFSVESKKALKIKELRLEKSRQPQNSETPAVVVKTETVNISNKKRKKNKNQMGKGTKINDDSTSSDQMKYAGTYATPGTKKFLNNLNSRQQTAIHKKVLKKEKTKSKILINKIPRRERKALKMENMTRPKKPNKDDAEFTKLVSKYKTQITKNAKKKKWFE